MNPPKKLTVIIAAVLVVLGLVLAFAGKALIGAIICAVSAILMICGAFVKGL